MTILKQHARRMCCLVALVLSACCVYAQSPRVEMFWNPQNKSDTVIDFGVTLEGFTITRTITIRNLEAYEITVFPPIGGIKEPFLTISAAMSGDVRFNEFGSEPRPYTIPPFDAREFEIYYKPIQDGQYPPDVVAQAILSIRVAPTSNPTAETPFKRFLLRALKTTQIVSTSTNRYTLDSVLIGGSKLAIPTFAIRNSSNQKIPVDSFRVVPLSPMPDGPEIFASSPVPDNIEPNSTKSWELRYEPKNRGIDSAVLIVYYRPNVQAEGKDSILCHISGIGVEQKLRVTEDSEGAPRDIVISATRDTIDFGQVATGSGGQQAMLIIANEGSITVGYESEAKRYAATGGAPRDTAAFHIDRPLMNGNVSLKPNLDDTLVITFDPLDGGAHECEYVLQTDLLRRQIAGVPDGRQRYVLHLKGFGLRPQMRLSTPSIDFGNIVFLPTCTSVVERTIQISNVGNATLRIDSIMVSGSVGSVQASRSAFTIAPSKSDSITLRYAATAVGADAGQVTFVSNALDQTVVVPFTANVVSRDIANVSVASTYKAPPGRTIYVPVMVNGDAIRSTNVASFLLGFEPTLLEFKGLITGGTASAGSINTGVEQPFGQLSVSITMPTTFEQSDVLIILVFQTYLGKKAFTELAFLPGSVKFGNNGCSSVLDIRPTSGAFMLDSVCGLSALTVVPGAGYYNMKVYPNPTPYGTASVAVVSDVQRTMTMRVHDATGRIYAQHQLTADQGTSMHSLSLPELAPGVYYVELGTDDSRVVEMMVIQP